MSMISLRNFNGMVPRADTRALAPGMASAAVNCKLWSSQLRPWNGMVEHTILGKSGEIASIYRAFKESGKDNSGVFFHWNETVDVARSHINADSRERTYFTGVGKPKMTDNSIAVDGGNEYPMASRDIGVPVPQGIMKVTVGQNIVKTHSYTVSYIEEYPKGSGAFFEGNKSTRMIHVVRQSGNNVSLINIPVWKKKGRSIKRKRIYRSTRITVPIVSITVLSNKFKIELEYPHGLSKWPYSFILSGCDQNAYNIQYAGNDAFNSFIEDEDDALYLHRPAGAPANVTGENITLTYDLDTELLVELDNEQNKFTDNIAIE